MVPSTTYSLYVHFILSPGTVLIDVVQDIYGEL